MKRKRKKRETSGSQLMGWGCCLTIKPPGVASMLNEAALGVNAREEEVLMLDERATLMLGRRRGIDG